jgi:hypothetical protein
MRGRKTPDLEVGRLYEDRTSHFGPAVSSVDRADKRRMRQTNSLLGLKKSPGPPIAQILQHSSYGFSGRHAGNSEIPVEFQRNFIDSLVN